MSCFYSCFQKYPGFIEKSSPSEKNIVIVEEKLDYIDIDDIGNLDDSSILVFIDEECGNLIVVHDGRELTRNINRKKKSYVLQ